MQKITMQITKAALQHTDIQYTNAVPGNQVRYPS